MRKPLGKLALVLGVGFGLVLPAFAQHRGFSAAPAGGFSAPTRGFGAPARGFSGARHGGVPRRGSFPPLMGTPLNPRFAPINGVPGLGFDFPHLAAVSRGFRNRFHGFRFNDGFSSFFTPIWFDALPLYYPYDYQGEAPDYYTQGAQQPLFVIPSPQQPPQAPPETTPRESVTPQTPPQPPPELGQLILVRRDGEVLLAVAFTVKNGELTYITNQGTRRSFPVAELDKEATRQMNDANGTSVSLPN